LEVASGAVEDLKVAHAQLLVFDGNAVTRDCLASQWVDRRGGLAEWLAAATAVPVYLCDTKTIRSHGYFIGARNRPRHHGMPPDLVYEAESLVVFMRYG
jgi:hypothetical protein